MPGLRNSPFASYPPALIIVATEPRRGLMQFPNWPEPRSQPGTGKFRSGRNQATPTATIAYTPWKPPPVLAPALSKERIRHRRRYNQTDPQIGPYPVRESRTTPIPRPGSNQPPSLLERSPQHGKPVRFRRTRMCLHCHIFVPSQLGPPAHRSVLSGQVGVAKHAGLDRNASRQRVHGASVRFGGATSTRPRPQSLVM